METYLTAFQAAGAHAEALPLLEIAPPNDPRPLIRAASELGLYDWIAFTSANAVDALIEAAGGAIPQRTRLAAVGESTADALRRHGVEPALVAERAEAEGLAEILMPRVGRHRVLLPQAEDASSTLFERLRKTEADVEVVIAYSKRIPEDSFRRAQELFGSSPIGWVTFTSPSTFVNFQSVLQSDWPDRREELRAASIGPVTSAALRRSGVEPACEASEPSASALVEAVASTVRSG